MNRKLFDPRLWMTALSSDRNLLAVGAKAPSFTATAHDGRVVRSQELEDKKYVIWFYPAADTPGCTKQGCGFRDKVQEFKNQGVEVFGVSFDSVEDNAKFAAKYHLPFPLLSDTTRSMGMAFGAVDSADAHYANRIAYVIDHGKITHAYNVKDPGAHAEQVLRDVKS